jgi:hypothetical protein
MSEHIKRPISNSSLSINPSSKRMSKELNGSSDGQILEPAANHQETSQIPLTVPRRSSDEGKHASADFSAEYVSSQAIAMLPAMNRSRPASEVDASRHNFSDAASTITPSPGSDFSLFTNSKRDSDDQIDGRTNATGTMTSGQASGNWGWFEDVHNDPAATSPKVRKGRDGANEADGDQENGGIRRSSEIRRGLLQFTMSNIKPLIDMVRSKQDQGKKYELSVVYVRKVISRRFLWTILMELELRIDFYFRLFHLKQLLL